MTGSTRGGTGDPLPTPQSAVSPRAAWEMPQHHRRWSLGRVQSFSRAPGCARGPLPDHRENPGLSLMPGPEFSVFGALGTPHTPILALLTAKGRPVEKLSEREREMRLNEAGVF